MSDRSVDRWRRYWNKHAATYDRQMGFFDRWLFRDSRAWVCGRAGGDVLEVAVGTGLNLPFYPAEAKLTGIDLSAAMLHIARARAADLGRTIDLLEGDARHLTFPDASFDAVVCTFGLCAIPDHRQALVEMTRVLKPGGSLLLADHVQARTPVARAVQRVIELGSVPLAGEHFLRRPSQLLPELGYRLERQQRFGPFGVVERVAACLPGG